MSFPPVIFPFRSLRSTIAWLTLLLAASRAGAATEAEGWQALAGYLFRDAYDAFAAVATDSRTRTLGLAASHLNHPPVTAGKIAQTEAQLRALVAADGTDEAARYARFLLARIAHLHRPAAIAEVEAAYREAIAGAPGHPVSQLAAGKLALVYLYQRPDLTVPQRLEAAAGLAAVAGAEWLPESACAYYRNLAGAALYYDICDERVLGWLRRAAEIGTQDLLVTANLRIQLAEVARELGHREEALDHYRSFLADILPTDSRYLTARERMLELAGTKP